MCNYVKTNVKLSFAHSRGIKKICFFHILFVTLYFLLSSIIWNSWNLEGKYTIFKIFNISLISY